MTLSSSDTEKLLQLQQECDLCKEAMIVESDIPIRESMQEVCEMCKKVRLRVPQLMELRHKLEEANKDN